MAGDAFEEQIERALAEIKTLPESQRRHLEELVEETRERHESIQRWAREGLDVLDDWRLSQKYRLFDADARKRESGSDGNTRMGQP